MPSGEPKIPFKTFAVLQEFAGLVHGYSTRQGGVSRAPYHWLNLGMHTGDDPERVRQNRGLYFEALGVPADRLVFPEQVHGKRVEIVNKPGIVSQCDGLITDQPNLYLTIQTADCFPVFLLEEEQGVVALLHSGWRGTAANIVAEAIRKMVAEFSVRPENMVAAVGAGIQQTCYQVDAATAQRFDDRYLIPDGEDHFLLNVQANIVDQLITAGIPADRIEADATCTHCATDMYYSYRRDGRHSGRMMAVIGMGGK